MVLLYNIYIYTHTYTIWRVKKEATEGSLKREREKSLGNGYKQSLLEYVKSERKERATFRVREQTVGCVYVFGGYFSYTLKYILYI